MAYNDIQRLRQQNVFAPTEDISMGDMGYGAPMDYGQDYDQSMGYGGDMGGGYNDTSQSPYDRPPTSMPAEASSGQAGMGAPPPVTPPKVPGSYDPNASIQATIDAINRVYTPENIDRDRLRKLMDSVPERQAPSFARALVAGGLSIKAQDPVATAEKVLYAPHYRNMADWTAKADPFLKTAELENRANINERTLAGNVVTSVTAAERLAEQARQADQKNEVAGIRARAYAAKNSGWNVMVAGDRIVAVNPTTHQRQDLGESGKLDEATRLDIIGDWGVQRAEASGKAALDRAIAAGGQIVQDENGNLIVVNPRTVPPSRTTVPGGPMPGATKLGTPGRTAAGNSLESRRQLSDALKNVSQYDEENKRWVKKNNNGTYDFKDRPVASPGGWLHSPVTEADVKSYDEFRHSIDPSYKPPPDKPGGIGGSMGSGKEATPKSQGLGPKVSPGAAVGTGPGGYSPQTESPSYEDIELPNEKVKTYTSKSNPMNKRRTNDGGKTFEYSHDGGQTWGKR